MRLQGVTFSAASTPQSESPQRAVNEAAQRRGIVNTVLRGAQQVAEARRNFVSTQALARYNEENSAFRREMDKFDTITAAQADEIASQYGVDIDTTDKQFLRKDQWYPQVLERQLAESRERNLQGIEYGPDRRDLDNRLRADELNVLEREGAIAAQQAREAQSNEERAAVRAALDAERYDEAVALVTASTLYQGQPEAKAEMLADIDRKREEVAERASAELINTQVDEVMFNGSDAEVDALAADMKANRDNYTMPQAQYRAAINRLEAESKYRKRGTATSQDELARTAVNDFASVAKAAPLSITDAAIADTRAKVKGTPYEASFEASLAVFDQQFDPAADRAERIAELSANASVGDLTGGSELEALVRQDDAIRQAAREDGMTLGAAQGIVGINGQPIPVDFTDPASVQAAFDDAKKLSMHYSAPGEPVNVSPFTRGQAAQFVALLDGQATTPEAVAILESMNKAGAPLALWGQLAGTKGGIGYAMAAATNDPNAMAAIIDGQRVSAADPKLKPSGQEGIEMREEFNDIVGTINTTYGSQDYAANYDAAVNAYVGLGGTGDFDKDTFRQAVNLVTGGMATVNGGRVELPRGADAGQFEDFIDFHKPHLLPPGIEKGTGMNRDELSAYIRGSIPRKLKNGNYYFIDAVTEQALHTLENQDGRTVEKVFQMPIDVETVNSFNRSVGRRR